MMASEYISLKYIRVHQPIGVFYISSISWKDLIAIAKADIRKIHDEGERNDNFDSYLGIQRKISPNRIKEISQYVKTIDATFPTSIILNIQSVSKIRNGEVMDEFDVVDADDNSDITEVSNIKLSDDEQSLLIRKDEKVARILDGQHRIEGLRHGFISDSDHVAFDFNVTIFIDLDIDDQAQVFSVINKAQTKVNKSLVYDLYDYAKTRSPQKTAHDIVRLLNKMEGSPFYRKIKILGTAEDKERETIAQATLVELIITYISKNPMKDRDDLKRTTLFGKQKLHPISSHKEHQQLFFRNLFIQENDEVILSILWNYFKAVEDKWTIAWRNPDIEGNILPKSTGIIALMKFLKFAIISLNKYDQPIEKAEFQSLFSSVSLQDDDFNKEIFIPGSSGQSKLLKKLLADTQI